MRQPIGKIGIATTSVAVIMSLFHLYTAAFGSLEAMLQRSIHLSFGLFLAFMFYPLTKKSEKVKFYDCILSVLAFVPGFYVYLEYERLSSRWPFADVVTPLDMFMGILLLLLLAEAARRVMGHVMVLLAGLFFAYGVFGQYIPGKFGHDNYPMSRIIEYLYMTTDGIYGIPLGASATYVILFIIFGAFLNQCGSGKFFMDLAISLTGKTRGGPAKIGVISSAFFGTISGASVANVYATGTFTIPLMIRIGYQPRFAGAVEAVASTGGQLMPPIMGSAAFIMADMLGMPYLTIMKAAVIPAILYFLAVYVMIDIEAAKTGLQGLKEDELPDRSKVLKEIYFLIPPLLIVAVLVMGYTPLLAALFGIISAIIVGQITKENRMKFMDFIDALANGAKGAVLVAIATATAGIIVGIATKTGIGFKFTGFVTSVSGGNVWLAGILVMIASLILGMGLPTVAAFIMVAALAAPALIEMGVTPMAAQMFVLYFCAISTITPPVALSAYAGASIAGSEPFRTGFTAMRLGLVAYLVPFMFLTSGLLLFEGPVIMILIACFTAIIGAISLGAAIQGWFITKCNFFVRIILAGIALCTIKPGLLSDIFGLGLLLLIYLLQKKKNNI